MTNYKKHKSRLQFEYRKINNKLIKIPLIDKNTSTHLFSKNIIQNCFPEFFEYIKSLYPNIDNWMERIYLYVHGMKDFPKCKTCGHKPTFLGFNKGYRLYCSPKCSANNPNTREQCKQTKKELYGDENYNNMRKNRQTKLERHGDENYNNPEKNKKTCLKKFGVENPMQVKEIKEKAKNTINIKYGGYRIMAEESKTKMIQTKRNQSLEKIENLLGYSADGAWIINCSRQNKCFKICENCPGYYIIDSRLLRSRKIIGVELCTNLNPVKISRSGLEDFVCNFLDELKLKFERNKRNLIKDSNNRDSELDIFIPGSNLAIEINGTYWHSLKEKEPEYHIGKFNACKNKGIELISIWEDWFNDLVLLKGFILVTVNRNDKSKYKEIWFPDLKENEWPNDLGWYKSMCPPGNPIEHKIFHGKYECSDSGITII